MTALDPAECDAQVLRMLELLVAGSRKARFERRADRARVHFLALKDEAMAVLHGRFGATGRLSYHLIPYLRRCRICKNRADALHAADPSRSWEYHLNLLPPCAADEEDLERGRVSMTARCQDREFELHAPIKEALKWSLNVQDLARHVWVPESDFDRVDVAAPGSLQSVVDELRQVLDVIKDDTESKGPRPCTVFLSAASTDYELATRVRDFLAANRKEVFLAPVSLATQGDANYRRAIEHAVDSAEHMIVIVSRPENAGSQWVEYEWGLFLNEKLAGRKVGNLLTVAPEPCRYESLPIALRAREVLPLTDHGLQRLLGYLK